MTSFDVPAASVASRDGGRWRLLALLGLAALLACGGAAAEDWQARLADRVTALDAHSPGNLGVYVKHLGQQRELSYQAERDWYLSSTVKVPVAVALLQKVEAGELSLDDELTLRESDFVDGAGDLLWHPPGSRHSLAELLGHMLEDSDSTATDMLIRLIGEEELYRRIRETMSAEGFHPFTTILQVRYDAYAELHPSVEELSNMDFVRLNNTPLDEGRYEVLLRKLPVGATEVNAASLEEAFERYYQRKLNSGTLEAFGHLLERLLAGELVGPGHTARILRHMEAATTGAHRIQAGLAADVPFAQKTGTQVARACNVGILHPRSPQDAVVVVACIERYDDLDQAEETLAQLGAALQESGVVRSGGGE